MPELPEVETIRRGLKKLLLLRRVANETHDWPRGFPNKASEVKKYLIGAKITNIRRRAKVLLIDLSTDYSLVIHLKMTGQLVFRGEEDFGGGHPTNSLLGKLPDRSTRVTIKFTDGSNLFFNDQRKFGWMRLMPTADVPGLDFFKKLGPEPLDRSFTAMQFAQRLKKRAKSGIKAALLDQSVVSGIGNIYADESLWAAKIHPETKVGNLTDAQIKKLFGSIKSVLKLGIEKGGASDRNYVNAEGEKGNYLAFAKVFRREGKPCPRCGTKIIKIRVAGRGTHICPYCQKKQN